MRHFLDHSEQLGGWHTFTFITGEPSEFFNGKSRLGRSSYRKKDTMLGYLVKPG
jgi:hypothetical protein